MNRYYKLKGYYNKYIAVRCNGNKQNIGADYERVKATKELHEKAYYGIMPTYIFAKDGSYSILRG